MPDPDKGDSNSRREASRHLEESVSSGRITEAEADIVRRFFAAASHEKWPANELQRRMQGSGG